MWYIDIDVMKACVIANAAGSNKHNRRFEQSQEMGNGKMKYRYISSKLLSSWFANIGGTAIDFQSCCSPLVITVTLQGTYQWKRHIGFQWRWTEITMPLRESPENYHKRKLSLSFFKNDWWYIHVFKMTLKKNKSNNILINCFEDYRVWQDLSKPSQREKGPDPRPLLLSVGTPSALGPELAYRMCVI